jgi:hypothetical protein
LAAEGVRGAGLRAGVLAGRAEGAVLFGSVPQARLDGTPARRAAAGRGEREFASFDGGIAVAIAADGVVQPDQGDPTIIGGVFPTIGLARK